MSADLMFQDEIREVVRAAYRALPAGAGRTVATRLYDAAELARVPPEAVDWALGVGNPVRHARLSPGDRVVDLGCGGGIDAVLCAHRVGPAGKVVAVDALPEMCERTRAAAAAAGVADRVEVVRAEMEDLPLPDDHVDVVVSNGVVNLSPRKSRALAEAARVLRPGGRFCVADLVVDDELPPEVLASGAVWAGCVAGALSEVVFTRKLERVGFVDVEVTGDTAFSLDDAAAYPLFTPDVLDLMRRVLPADAAAEIATSVIVRARHPGSRAATTDPPTGTSMTTGVRHLDDVPLAASTHDLDGVQARVVKQFDDVAFKVLEVTGGSATPFHTHLQAHEGLVVGGVGALQLQDRRLPLRPGHVFSVRPNEPHAIHAEEGGDLRLVCLDCLLD